MSFLWTEYNYEDEQRVLRKEALAEGLSMGRAEGLSLGRAEERLASAKRMKSKGFSDDEIADILDVPKSKLKDIYTY